MCEIVKASNLLALILAKTPSVTCETLINIRNSIEDKYSDIIVDVSKHSITRAYKRYPYLFKIVSDKIEQSKDFSTLPSTYLQNEFYNPINEGVLKKVRGEVEYILVRMER